MAADLSLADLIGIVAVFVLILAVYLRWVSDVSQF
jgi:hypothetical protein